MYQLFKIQRYKKTYYTFILLNLPFEKDIKYILSKNTRMHYFQFSSSMRFIGDTKYSCSLFNKISTPIWYMFYIVYSIFSFKFVTKKCIKLRYFLSFILTITFYYKIHVRELLDQIYLHLKRLFETMHRCENATVNIRFIC